MAKKTFSFTISALRKKTRARAGIINTARGEIETPVFMPVGTAASVKALSPDDLFDVNAQIILANTYHLYLRPGDKKVKKMGGLHSFMNWKSPILTDSGGYQVSSQGHFIDESQGKAGKIKRSIIDDEGVVFFSHIDGSKHVFTPEKSIEIQENLGADIIMAFDEATPDKGKKYAQQAMKRTHVWLERSIDCWRELEQQKEGSKKSQALFGIIQGGNYKELRRESAEFVVGKQLSGIAIGGGSIGRDIKETEKNLSWIKDLLPKDKPIYLMGVGVNPEDLISAVESGADMFDCVAPTRLARMGQLYCGLLKINEKSWGFDSEFKKGRLNIANARFVLDGKTIGDDCDCYTCKSGFTRAYLHHLFKSRELLYYRLASIHNVRFMIRLVGELRKDILQFEERLIDK